MELEKIKYYAGKKVLIILYNGFKLTTNLPPDVNQELKLLDKFNQQAIINVADISSIVEVRA